jgi:hypothetical protein
MRHGFFDIFVARGGKRVTPTIGWLQYLHVAWRR